jgi:transcriptional regulator with XRE-family HTH domain
VTVFKFKNLDGYREQKLISRAELARKTGLSPLTINKLEGGRACRPDTAKKILESLQIYHNGSDFNYDETSREPVVFTSPPSRANGIQLMLIRVSDEPSLKDPGRKAKHTKATDAKAKASKAESAKLASPLPSNPKAAPQKGGAPGKPVAQSGRPASKPIANKGPSAEGPDSKETSTKGPAPKGPTGKRPARGAGA